MKQLLLFIFIACSSYVNAQTFVATPTGLYNSDDTAKNFVVIRVDSVSAKDLYSRAYSYIQHNWKNPEIANNGKVEGEFLHVKTFVPDLLKVRGGMMKMYANLHYTINLDFKDGKVRYEISDVDMYINGSKGDHVPYLFMAGGMTWSIFKKNGEIASGQQDAKDQLETYINTQITELTKSLSTAVAKNDF